MERCPMFTNCRINIVKINKLPKTNLQRQGSPHQKSNLIFHRNRIMNPKLHLEAQKNLINQSNPELKEQLWRYHNTWFQLYYRAITTKQQDVGTNRHVDKWTKDTEISPDSNSHLIFATKVRSTYFGEKTACSKNSVGKTGYSRRRLKSDFCLSPCTKINSKWAVILM
jgi:hypothetical protein